VIVVIQGLLGSVQRAGLLGIVQSLVKKPWPEHKYHCQKAKERPEDFELFDKLLTAANESSNDQRETHLQECLKLVNCGRVLAHHLVPVGPVSKTSPSSYRRPGATTALERSIQYKTHGVSCALVSHDLSDMLAGAVNGTLVALVSSLGVEYHSIYMHMVRQHGARVAGYLLQQLQWREASPMYVFVNDTCNTLLMHLDPNTPIPDCYISPHPDDSCQRLMTLLICRPAHRNRARALIARANQAHVLRNDLEQVWGGLSQDLYWLIVTYVQFVSLILPEDIRHLRVVDGEHFMQTH